MTKRVMICQLCRKRVHQQRNGAWYHDHNSSVACRPGEGGDRRATPMPGRGAQDWSRRSQSDPEGNVPGPAGVAGRPAETTVTNRQTEG
jgi:hypothetical protein